MFRNTIIKKRCVRDRGRFAKHVWPPVKPLGDGVLGCKCTRCGLEYRVSKNIVLMWERLLDFATTDMVLTNFVKNGQGEGKIEVENRSFRLC